MSSSLILPLPCIYNIAEGTQRENKSNNGESFILETEDPEIWMISYQDGSMAELWQALEDDFQEKISHIRHEEIWLQRFQCNESYYRYPMSYDDGVAYSLEAFGSPFGLGDALRQFEEDLDYEIWVSQDKTQSPSQVQQDNLHMICAAQWDFIEKPFEEIGIEYVGQLTEESASSVKQTGGGHYATVVKAYEAEDEFNITIEVGDTVVVENDSDEDWWSGYVFMKENAYKGYFPACFVRTTEKSTHCQIGTAFLKDRYKIKATVSTHHPLESKGYAKARSNFGDIYIPEKFRNFIPPIGENVTITAALQDVGDSTRKGNSFRWTAIYIH
jgi:hypothetical protein